MALICFVAERWDLFRSSLDVPQLASLQMELLCGWVTMSQPVVRLEELARGAVDMLEVTFKCIIVYCILYK